jgi:hypothetical protein
MMPTIDEDLQTETSFSVGSALTPVLGNKDERRVDIVTCETTRTRVDDNQDTRSTLGQCIGHTSHLKPQQTD